MSHKKFIKDLNKIKKELAELPVKSDTTVLRNNLISLLLATTGDDSPHVSFVRDLKFYPTGITTFHGQDLHSEAWNKSSKELDEYIVNLITTYEYKNKYPKPLEYTRKMTIPWILKNLPLKTLLSLFSFLVVAYGLGVKYHQPTTKLGNNIWQQLEKVITPIPQEKETKLPTQLKPSVPPKT